MWSEWSVLIACIPFQSCSTLFQPFLGTMDHLDPINAVFDPFDPVWDLPGTTFWYLGWCNVVPGRSQTGSKGSKTAFFGSRWSRVPQNGWNKVEQDWNGIQAIRTDHSDHIASP